MMFKKMNVTELFQLHFDSVFKSTATKLSGEITQNKEIQSDPSFSR